MNDLPSSKPLKIQFHVGARPPAVEATTVEEGQTWRFHATGHWTDWFVRTTPGGYSSLLARLFGFWPQAPGAPLFALVAQVFDGHDEPKETFVIGTGVDHVFKTTGRLVVFANDIDFMRFNNRGVIELNATLVNSPGLEVAAGGRQEPRKQVGWSLILETMDRTRGFLFITFAVAAACGVLAFSAQGQDLVSAVCEDDLAHGPLCMTLAVTWLAFQGWFWARRIVEVNYGLDRKQWGPGRRFLEIAPRLIGASPFAFVFFTVWSSDAMWSKNSAAPATLLILLAAFLAFVWFVLARQGFVDEIHRKAREAL